MNKLEEISNKFLLLKNKLDKSDITFLCNHSFRSITGGIKGLYKIYSTPKITNTNNKKNEKEMKMNINNFKPNSEKKNDYFKNLLISLESTKNNKIDNNKNEIKKGNDKSKSVTPSIKNQSDNSPTIVNDDENHINKNEELDSKSNTHKIIPLNEDEDEDENTNSINTNNKKQLNSHSKRQNNNKMVSINIIDKHDKNLNIKEKINEKFIKFDTLLTALTQKLQKMNSIEIFYNEQKQKIISVNLIDNNIIHIETIKKIIHLFFNTLSKIFNFLTKETENICSIYLNNIFDIIKLIIDFIKQIKNFIKNNNNTIELLFLKNIKTIGNYCLYVLYIKKYNYDYMLDIQKRNDNNKVNEFFNIYLKYLKIIRKMKQMLKDNVIFIKHFMIQPNMLSFIDLFEMNRKIINYQLNAKFK